MVLGSLVAELLGPTKVILSVQVYLQITCTPEAQSATWSVSSIQQYCVREAYAQKSLSQLLR